MRDEIPAGVNRLTAEWACKERKSCHSAGLKRKTGLTEEAQQTETASSPTAETSRGVGSREDGSKKEREEKKKAELKKAFVRKQAKTVF